MALTSITSLTSLTPNLTSLTSLTPKKTSQYHLLRYFPHHDTSRNAHVERVFRAKLRYLYATVGGIDHLLMHALHLVAEHQSVAARGVELQVMELRGTLDLLHGIDEHALTAQLLHRLKSRGEVTPRHGVLAAERGLVYFGVRRSGGDAAEIDRLHTERVAGTEHRPYIL